jgi:hypothetical protein
MEGAEFVALSIFTLCGKVAPAITQGTSNILGF